jgi:hypothetical protein
MRGAILKSVLWLTLVFAIIEPSLAQNYALPENKYNLLTMPYNHRPLTLYQGQVEINGGYKFAVRSQSYTADGQSIYLKDNGTGSVYHFYFADLSYGITDFMQAGISTNMLRHGQREQTTTITANDLGTSERVTVNKLTEVKGMGDLLIFTTLRLPIKYRWFDFAATGGLFIPTSQYKEQKPQNTVVSDLTAVSSYTVNYHYNQTNGYGVPVYLLSASVKGGYWKLFFEGDFIFKTPKEEGTNVRWEATLVDKIFTYYEKPYQYLLSNSYTVNGALHYQATGWFDLFFNTSWQKTKGGWTEYNGKKYENRETSLLTLEPGFELKISPTFTIGQLAGFPVSGVNSDAPFYLLTTIRFDFFPFFR